MANDPSDKTAPVVWPVYAKKARIEGGRTLHSRLPDGLKVETLADIARCHPNTVRTALEGRSVLYVKAHGVFTALNVISRNAFSRADHVRYYETNRDEPAIDEALRQCGVLHRGPELQRRSSLKAEAIAEEAGLGYLDVALVLTSGKPAPISFVRSVFDVFHKRDPKLIAAEEIVG